MEPGHALCVDWGIGTPPAQWRRMVRSYDWGQPIEPTPYMHRIVMTHGDDSRVIGELPTEAAARMGLWLVAHKGSAEAGVLAQPDRWLDGELLREGWVIDLGADGVVRAHIEEVDDD